MNEYCFPVSFPERVVLQSEEVQAVTFIRFQVPSLDVDITIMILMRVPLNVGFFFGERSLHQTIPQFARVDATA